MDSCVCAALAARDYDAAALHVSYGQRTEDREREAFSAICDRLGIQKRLVVRNQAPLGEPRTGVAEWRRIASDFHAYDLARDAEHHALRTRDVGLWHRAYNRTVGVLDHLAVDLGAAQVPSTNECMRLFG